MHQGPNYGFGLRHSEEDEGYVATVPAFDGLTAFGETAEEALTEAQAILTYYIEQHQKQGVALPRPRKPRG